MNATEYADYQTRFAQGMDGLTHFSSGSWLAECVCCGSESQASEPYFSWHRCELCDSTLGGNRTDAHAIYDGAIVHLRVCDDCVYYAEYGRLDDATMLEVEANA